MVWYKTPQILNSDGGYSISKYCGGISELVDYQSTMAKMELYGMI